MDISEEYGGPLPGARIVVSEMGTAFFQPEGGEKEYADGNVISDNILIDAFLARLGKQWNRCNGIPHHIYQEYSTNVRYKPEVVTEDRYSVRSSMCAKCFF